MGISLAALVPALIGVATTGTSIGLEASGALGGGSSGPSATQLQEAQNEQQQKTQQQQEQQTFRGAAPNAQAQTGGSLSSSSLSSLIAELSGSPADTNLAQQTIFGNVPGLSTGS
jgi:hypothetical protein